MEFLENAFLYTDSMKTRFNGRFKVRVMSDVAGTI